VPALALTLALLAAVVHAIWNLLIARSDDSQAATAVAVVTGALLLTPIALATWSVEAAALPYAAASAALEVAYFLLLAEAYQRGELSVVYPVARGAAPLLVLVATFAIGATVGAAGVVGVCLIVVGISLVRGIGRHAERRAVGLAVMIAACIAAYTLIDKGGLRHASALPYLLLITIPSALLVPALVVRRRGLAPLRAQVSASTLVAGAFMTGAFALVLAALQRVPQSGVPAVEAVRESSVVVAVVLARIVLSEPVTRMRFAGACLVAGGVGALALAA
jgi:drug/metabolite transporter (DMT)-like permease